MGIELVELVTCPPGLDPPGTEVSLAVSVELPVDVQLSEEEEGTKVKYFSGCKTSRSENSVYLR